MCKLNSVVIVCLVSVMSVKAATTQNKMQEVIGFPEKEENLALANKDNRQPVYSPSICPVNELYYPGDQKDDWICDCMPGHIFLPVTDQCWPAYRQGPCPEGEYLILPNNSFIPVCEKNPCLRDGFVLLHGSCHMIGTTAPCAELYPVVATVGVNATNLAITCVKLNLDLRFPSSEERRSACQLGCKKQALEAVKQNTADKY